ncbi:MAG: hypothetical protein QOG90_24 [Actinomycetota bacterium]|jgi:hypothetical protein
MATPEDDPYVGVRTEIARFLGPSAFPGDKARLVAVARDNEANPEVLRALDDLPGDTTFNTTQEVIDAIPLNGAQPDG